MVVTLTSVAPAVHDTLSSAPYGKMMRGMVLLIFACAAVEANDLSEGFSKWKEFKQKYGKSYSTVAEELKRLNIFLDNKRNIDKHNEEFDGGVHTYKIAMNQFGDLTDEEFASSVLGVNGSLNKHVSARIFDAPANISLPHQIDWRQQGYVTAVKAQGICGSCWAFGTIGSVEGQWFKKTGQLVALSEQNLLDCSLQFGTRGCNGGDPAEALNYIIANGGVNTEASYPYEERVGPCRFDKGAAAAKVEGYIGVKQDDESDLQAAIATVGPITVLIDAGHGFRFYSSGVYYSRECGSHLAQLNHAVVAVGYGVSCDGQKYYIVKNSWGARWGDHGYILMSRDRGNNCGIATQATYPLV